jgi:hypothetical protein
VLHFIEIAYSVHRSACTLPRYVDASTVTQVAGVEEIDVHGLILYV